MDSGLNQPGLLSVIDFCINDGLLSQSQGIILVYALIHFTGACIECDLFRPEFRLLVDRMFSGIV